MGDVITERVETLIDRFDKESQKHKRIHRRCQVLILVLGALTTITAGSSLILPEGTEKAVQFALLVMTSLMAGLTGYEAHRRARDLWQLERTLHHNLRDIKFQIEWLESQGDWHKANQALVLARVQDLLGSSTEDWKASLNLQQKPSQPADSKRSP